MTAKPRSQKPPARRLPGWIVGRVTLAVSAIGFPLTQLAIRRWGRLGAGLTELVCGGLLLRDIAMLISGVPARLRPGPAALLWLETGSAGIAAITNLAVVTSPKALSRAAEKRPTVTEQVRRAAIGTLFGLHTVRFAIYLRPNRGRRTP